jgi:hypothetical protein
VSLGARLALTTLTLSNASLSGGYFKRFKGGALQPWVHHPDYRDKLTLEERITLTFLQVRSGIPYVRLDADTIILRE